MNTRQGEQTLSIRKRLLELLLLPAVLTLAAGTLSDYFTSVTPFHEAYDQSLIDGALAVAAYVRPDARNRPRLSLPPEAVAILRADSSDSIYFRVSDADGMAVAGELDLPEAPRSSTNPSRADATYRGAPIRVVSYRTYSTAGMLTVSVAETTRKRDGVRRRILSSALAVDFVELGILLAVIGLGVRLALLPLREVREQIVQRSARDLAPLALHRVPVEIRSIVESLNRLFTTVSESSTSQRRFLESAAHQLRTPLTGIQAQLELMVADEPEEAKRQRLDLILGAARRLTHTTQQLLALARSEEGANLRWEMADVDLAPLAEESLPTELRRPISRESTSAATFNRRRFGAWAGWSARRSATSRTMQSPTRPRVAWSPSDADGSTAHRSWKWSIRGRASRPRIAPAFSIGSSGATMHVARAAGSGWRSHGATLTIDDGPEGKGTSVRMTFRSENADRNGSRWESG
ncbi:MAG: sensor histidine kinase [Gammaproteobacteria bacterium]